jgi:hypothetical protein
MDNVRMKEVLLGVMASQESNNIGTEWRDYVSKLFPALEYAEEMRRAEYRHAIENLEQFAEGPMKKLYDSIQIMRERDKEAQDA